MSVFEDLWKGLTGETAMEEGQKQAREETLEAQNNAAMARVFAETEGQGVGNMGSVALSVPTDDEDEDEVRKRNNLSV